MHQHRLRDVLRGLASIVVLAALLAGVPLALARIVGWPLPHAVPNLTELRRALNGPSISDAVLVKTLAVIAWLGWAQVIACTLVEVGAWAGGRAAHAVPLAGPVQPWVRQLVVTATLLLAPLRPSSQPTLVTAATPVSLVAPATAVVSLTTVSDQPTASLAPTTAASAQTPKTYVVRPRDDLWLLAERHLGNPLRYKELFALNHGVPQPDGRALHDPDLIRPGWILRFPDDAVGLPEQPDPAPLAAPARTPAPTPAPANASSTPACEPGAAPASDSPAATAPPAPQAPARDPEPRGTPLRASSPDEERGSRPALPLGILGAGLTATGVVVTLDRLRRVQQRRRHRGRVIRLPGPKLAPAEVALRHAADASPASRLDLALRALAGVLAVRQSGPMPTVEAVAVGDAAVEVLLSEAVEAPSGPFVLGAGGRALTLSADVADADLIDLAHGAPALVPGLVTVGTSEAGTILIDLEAAAVTALVGEAESAEAAVAAMAIELATSVWADDLHVVLVGTKFPGLSHLERVRAAAHVHDAIDEVAADVAATARALADAGHPSTSAARVSPSASDGWTPTIVLCTRPTDEGDAMDELLALAEQGRGLALVVVGDIPDADRRITFKGDDVLVDPPGMRVARIGLATADAAQIDELLVVAADADGGEGPLLEDLTETTDDVADTVQAADAESAATTRDGEQPSTAEVEINVVGPVEIVGAKGVIDRRKSVELLAYLATHPGGVNDDVLKCALWPDELPTASVFSTTVSLARSRLGTAADGAHHFPHVANGRYQLGPTVTSDATRLEAAVRSARHQPATEAIATLTAALELVRGLPFSGTKGGYEWTHTDGITARLEALASEAAHRLAELALDAGDPSLAQWAALQGLLASPGDEVLYRDRMLAADAAGNPAGVEAAFEELCKVVDALEPYDSLHPETIAVYERLSHRRRPTG